MKLANYGVGADRVSQNEQAGEITLDAFQFPFVWRLFADAVDFGKDLFQRRSRYIGGDVRHLQPECQMMTRANLAERRVGVAFLLANIGSDTRGKRSTQQRIQYVEHDVVGAGGAGNRKAQVERGLRGAGTVD